MKVLSILILCYAVSVQAKSAGRPKMALIEDIQPANSGVEDQQYWLDYGMKDLQNRLRMKNSNNIAKNVILFVGDGMGIQTGTMSRIFKGQKNGKTGENDQLIWESFPNTGISKTYNANYQVTDSAGAATALLSGVKTNFGVLGIDSSIPRNTCDPEAFEKAKIKNIFHWAVEEDKNIGLVTTTRVTHATPGAAYSHTTDRNWENNESNGLKGRDNCNEDVAMQLIKSDIGQKLKVIFGGGRQNFLTKEEGGKRTDKNLVDEYQKIKEESGETTRYMETKEQLFKWASEGMEEDTVMGLFANSHMSYFADLTEDSDEPSLTEMVEYAVKKLNKDSEDDGFFMLVESGRIDHAHHATLAQKAMAETVQFDNAIQNLFDNDLIDLDETLIIVTADHSHAVTINGYPKRGNNILGHSFQDPLSMAQFKDGTKFAYSTISYANGPSFEDHFTGGRIVPWKDMRDLDYTNKEFRHPAMMPGPEKDESHGGEDVGIWAIGPMSQLVVGVHEENYIAHVMAYSACLGPYKDMCDRKQRMV